ncbi:hypothetical protein GCM10018793_63520 [Streptomyces sulfonofaciens]|uniref:CHRD domain-containing protein n=1 Tax=Streptomyces sulfonofaciens TaxID=68272 RepID=A0A919GMD9_9ACTN|nr:CHRD domain-containing protein [Streptomyces sulfonofaciens]GHH87500.1 hypothetical protein GCM10018793_63520 [Streptomyces sulfonofaciens]
MLSKRCSLLAAAAVLTLATAAPAVAHAGHPHGGSYGASTGAGMPGMDMPEGTPGARGAAPTAAVHGPATYYEARLTGAQEVQVPGQPPVGDPDGSAVALVTLKGDRVTFAFRWKNITAPTLGHIHQGRAGVNGDVKVPLFTTPMPDTVTAAAGQVTVSDTGLARSLRTDPAGFYLNLHTKEFPGGAVRGQLTPVSHRVNPLDIIHGTRLLALADGGQEVKAAGKKVDDPDGHAVAFMDPHGTSIDYSTAWVNIDEPTLGHIHQGALGVNGDVKVPLFTTPMPQNVFAASGTATGQDPALVARIRHNPVGFYFNLHTDQFPDGAVRGQLF